MSTRILWFRTHYTQYLTLLIVAGLSLVACGGDTSPPGDTNTGNSAPITQDINSSTTADTPVAITLLATDADGDDLSFEVSTTPSNGSLSGTAPDLTYTPSTDFTGTDSFTYQANDGTVSSTPSTVTITVTATLIVEALTASIEAPANDQSRVAGTVTNFTALVSGGTAPYGYAWNFDTNSVGGGPAASTQQNPGSIMFNSPGLFLVTLTVTDANSNEATDSRLITMLPLPLSAAINTPSAPPSIASGETVNFSGLAAGGVPPYNYAWNFDTNSIGTAPAPSTVQNPGSTTFPSEGEFFVTFTVTDATAAETSTTVGVSVVPPALLAQIDTPATDQSFAIPGSVDFTGSAQNGTPPYTYAWDFDSTGIGGGPAASLVQNPNTISFENVGHFIITLSVTDDNGDTASTKISVIAFPDNIILVDVNAPGVVNDGSSWAEAYTDITEAMDAAKTGDEVWLKRGSYVATSTDPVLTMKDDVDVYGGFSGTESAATERQEPMPVTILDGDQKSNQVVLGSSDAIFDGFTVTGGLSDDTTARRYISGAGMYNSGTDNLLVSNVIFVGNVAFGAGGGMFSQDATVNLNNVVFSKNTAGSGGGYSIAGGISRGNPILRDVLFSGNTSEFGGGGILISGRARLSVINTVFTGNSTTLNGGGAQCVGGNASVKFAGVTFFANEADFGAGMNTNNCSITITNGTFVNNTAETHGGAMRNASASPVLTNISFFGNTAGGYGGAIENYVGGSVTASNSVFWGNKANTVGPGSPGNDIHTSNTSSTLSNTCVKALTGTNMVSLTTNPFGPLGPDGVIYLNQSSECVDAGDDAAANDGSTGFVAMGLSEWSTMTTSADGSLDADTVDMGRHYVP